MGLQKIKPFFSASCLLDSSISTMIIFTPLAFKILEAIFPINPNPKIIIFSSNCILSFLIPFNAIDPKIEKTAFLSSTSPGTCTQRLCPTFTYSE